MLDVSHNQLTEIPLLSSMPKLKRLNLSHNYISEGGRGDFTQALADGGQNLKELNLGHNVFRWSTAMFVAEIKVLGTLRSLETLNFAFNAFTQNIQDYETCVLFASCLRLRALVDLQHAGLCVCGESVSE